MINISIFTRGYNSKLENLIIDLENQNYKNYEIIVFSDNNFKREGIKIIKCKNKNIAEKRNLAIKNSKSKYLLLLDDDNRIYNKNFLETLIKKHSEIEIKKGENIISPTIMFKDTKKIQSTGIWFCFILGKVFASKKKVNNYKEIKAIGGNSLFSKLETFKKNDFDEKIGFIGEDIDYCYSIRKKGVKIFIIDEKINHQERVKNIAEKSFVYGESFKRKIINRNIFVEKHGNLLQKIAFYLIGYNLGILVWKIKIILSKIKK